MSIRIFYDKVSFRIKGWKRVIKVIEKVILNNGKTTGNINVIITDDETLKEINVQFLKHNYYTDVITFDYSIGNAVSGEIYISIDSVKENVLNYNVSLKEEIRRVVIHGILHLVGYNDKMKKEKVVMKANEDFWLGRFED